MKSIKEKSNEYAKEYLFSPLPQRAPNIHFEAGANYVLNEIGVLLEAADKYEPHSIPTWRLRNIIEQLKK